MMTFSSPGLIVIAGSNGSGKTSVTGKIPHHEWLEDSEYINPDNVARDVFGDWEANYGGTLWGTYGSYAGRTGKRR